MANAGNIFLQSICCLNLIRTPWKYIGELSKSIRTSLPVRKGGKRTGVYFPQVGAPFRASGTYMKLIALFKTNGIYVKLGVLFRTNGTYMKLLCISWPLNTVFTNDTYMKLRAPLTLLTYPHAEAAATFPLLFFQQLLQIA